MRMKRWVSVVLLVCMLAGLLPDASVYAKTTETAKATEQKETVASNREEEIPEEWADTSSDAAPADRDTKEEMSVETEQRGADDVVYPDAKALLIEDNLPWDSVANHTVLGSIVPYDKIKASEIADTELSKYAMIVFANDQAFSTYSKYALVRDRLEEYVRNGGVLIFGACDSGWADGELVEELPGGVTKKNVNDYHNYIVDDTHPIVTRILSEGVSLENEDLYNNYCSHIYFVESSLPEGTDIILENESSHPTLIEYRMGKGTVIASGLTWEHNYVYGGTNGRGTYAKKTFDDLFLYGMSISQGNQLLTPQISYKVPADKVGVYVGNIKDQTGVKEISVTIDGTTVETNKYGVAEFSLESGEYQVTVEGKNYLKKTRKMKLERGNIKAMFVVPDDGSTLPYLEEAVLTKDTDKIDILQQRMYFTENDETEVSYDFTAELAGKEFSKFLLYQGTNILELDSASGTIQPGKEFEPEQPVYLQLVCKDGTKSTSYKTGIFIKADSSGFILYDKESSESFSFGQGVGYTVPGNIPIIGGTEFQYGIGNLPVTITTEANKVQIAVGFTDFQSSEDAWKDYVKKIDDACKTADKLDKLQDLCKAYGGKSGGFTLKKGWEEPEFSVAGYIEATWDENGTKLTSVSGKLMGGVKFEYDYSQQFIVGPVPVYFEIGAGFELGLSASVKKVLLETGEIQLNVPINFKPFFTIGGGAGINGALSAGAEGELAAPVEWDIANKHIKVTATGSMKLKASLLFVFSAEHEIASGEWVICDKSYADVNNGPEMEETVSQAIMMDMNDYEEYSLINTAYRANTSDWSGNAVAAARSVSDLTYEQILQEYVLPGTKPQMASAGGTTLMVFQTDNQETDVTKCVTLMYSVNTGDGWSEPQPVWQEQPEADYYAKLAVCGDDIYLVWQKAEPATEEEEAAASGELTEQTEITALAQKMEIAYARFDQAENAFADQRYVTDNDCYDGSAVLAKNADGTISVVWVENESSDILTPKTTSKILKSDLSGDSFTAPETLVTTDEYILSMSAGYVNDTLKVAYSADKDGDLNTSSDVECYLYDGGATALTDDETANLNPQIAGDVLYWFENDKIISYQLSNGTKTELGEGSANYRAVKTQNGTAIVFVRPGENETADIYAYEVTDGTAQSVSRISSVEGSVDSFDVYQDAAGSYHLVYGITEAGNGDNFRILYQETGLTNDLVLSSVSANDMDCQDGVQKAVLYVSNQGVADAEGFEVSVYENGDKVDSVSVEETVAAGEQKAVSITFDRDIVNEICDYQFVLESDNDRDSENNTAEIKLGYSDISLDVEEYYVDNQVEILAKVSNLTSRESDVEFKVYEDSLDGEVVFTRKLTDVNKEEAQMVSFSLDRGAMEVTPGEDKLFILTVTGEEDQATGDNQYLLLIPTLESEVTGITLEDGEENLVYDYDVYKGKTVQLKAEVAPAGIQADLTWISSDPSVASVDNAGQMTIKKTGTTTITVKVDDATSASVQVQILQIDKTAPTGVTVTKKTYDSLTLSWKALGTIKNYEVYRSESANGTYALAGRTSTETYTDPDVVLGKTYYYKVRGYINSRGEYIYTDFSKVISGKPALEKTSVSLSLPQPNVIRVSWNSVAGAKKYEVYRSESKTGTYKLMGSTTSCYYEDKTVVIGKTYYYTVAAVNGTNKGEKSAVVSMKAQLNIPSSMLISQEDYRTLRIRVSSVSGVDGYELYRASSPRGKFSLVKKSSDTVMLDVGLSLDRTYYYKVRSYKTINKKTYRSEFSAVYSEKHILPVPEWKEIAPAGETQVYLQWEAVKGATGYEVYECDSYNGIYKKIATTKETKYLRKKLKSNSGHYYKIRAYRKVGKKTYYSEENGYRYVTAGFEKPYGAKVVFNGSKNTITFGKCGGASGTEVSCANSYYGDYVVLTNTTKGTYVHSGVEPGKYYYYRLRSYRTVNGAKEYSGYKVVSVYTVPAQVENLKAASRSVQSVKLTWNKISWAKGYDLYRASSYSGSYQKVAEIEKGTTASYVDTGLTPGVTYYYKIKAYIDVNGYNKYGDMSQTVYIEPQMMLSKVSKTESYNAVTLKWSKGVDAAGYEIYRSTKANGTYKKIKTITKGTTVSYKDTKVSYGKTYYYKVRSYAVSNGQKYYSAYALLSAKACVSKPRIASVKSTGKKKVKLTWKKVSGVSGYEIYRSTSKNGKYQKLATVKKDKTVTYTDKKAVSGKTYYYKVRAYKKLKKKTLRSDYSSVKKCKSK